MFDISAFDTRTASVKGAKLWLKDPRTGKAWLNEQKEPLFIQFSGRNSDRFDALAVLANEARAAKAARDIEMTTEEVREERIDYVVGMTMGWNFETRDNKPFPFSESNARELFDDRRMNLLLNLSFQFIWNEVNFLADMHAA